MDRERHTWCMTFFASSLACESVENGIAECSNSVIVDARKKPLLAMFQEIRLYMMERLYNLREEAHKWEGDVCEAALLKMEEFDEDISTWYAVPSGEIPCVHEHLAILYTYKDLKEFINTWFSKSNYMVTYQSNILPVIRSNLWEETDYSKPLPPTTRRMSRRPSVKRMRHVSKHEDKYPQVSSKDLEDEIEVGVVDLVEEGKEVVVGDLEEEVGEVEGFELTLCDFLKDGRLKMMNFKSRTLDEHTKFLDDPMNDFVLICV
uniref:Uncharacterized protein n=1 Tax=Lactuca sativa TaxID=4236 RepID=A0A9R1XQ70_LACSA|nr:hypothetical protein LSAT_V11C300146930 [Lactuca sativa]